MLRIQVESNNTDVGIKFGLSEKNSFDFLWMNFHIYEEDNNAEQVF